MTSPTPLGTVNETVLRQMAAEIREEIPEAEVRLFGSHARGDARPSSESQDGTAAGGGRGHEAS